MSDANKITERWKALTPKARIAIVGVSTLTIIFFTSTFIDQPVVVAQVTDKKPDQVVSLTPPVNAGSGLEQLSASVTELIKRIDTEHDARLALEKKLAEQPSTQATPSFNTPPNLNDALPSGVPIDHAQTEQEPSPPNQANNDGGFSLPDPSLPPPATESAMTASAVPSANVILISGGDRKKAADSTEAEKKPPVPYLPMGSMFSVTNLSGMLAPTASATRTQPVPMLMKISSAAILPNSYRYSMKECFVMASGFGELSTERAQFRLIGVSCIKADGTIVEADMEGYIVGEDGKAGMRGRLVSTQGQLLAKSFAAGMFSSLGAAIMPTQVPQLNTTPGTQQQYQMPNLGAAGSQALTQGMAQTANNVSQFYLSNAKEMFQAIAIDANRKVTVVLTKGFEFKAKTGK